MPGQDFDAVVAAFESDPDVTYGSQGKTFGSRALKVKGKIFAMLTSKDLFVVKLPKARVSGLVAAGEGAPFDPGHGRLMKEWLTVTSDRLNWLDLAIEAYEFGKSRA